VPEFNELKKGTHGYRVDYKQFSPNIGVAWRPNVQSGFLRTILGDPEQATLRAGFSIGFNQPPVGTGVYGNNPGRSINATRNNNGATYLLVGPGEPWPVLFTETARLGPPPGIDTLSPAYPILAVPGNSLNLYDPNLKSPYTKSYSVGLQRAVGQNMAVEVPLRRHAESAQLGRRRLERLQHLRKRLPRRVQESAIQPARDGGAGPLRQLGDRARSDTADPGTGHSAPSDLSRLPERIEGRQQSRAYTAASFTNTTFIGRLNMFQPSVSNAALDLQTTARLSNGLLAGFPSNFWRMNPTVGTGAANMTMSGGNPSGGTNSGSDTKYDAFVVELRRRLSDGLLFSGSWTQAWRYAKVQNQFLRNTPRTRPAARGRGAVGGQSDREL
jgi:hypothetical protein